MLRQRSNNELLNKNKGITTILAMVVMLVLSISCTNGTKKLGDAIVERDSLPSMRTLGVTNLISDSGITRYRIETEEWLVFDRKDPPYWAFEKGVYLEKFDSVFNIEASIKADTAYYYIKKKLWELIGNVEIRNLKDEKYNTELLYWNETTERVYSDKPVRIEQPDRIIIAYGFESNQQMTEYTFHNMEGVFDVEDDGSTPPVTQNDSISPVTSTATDNR